MPSGGASAACCLPRNIHVSESLVSTCFLDLTGGILVRWSFLGDPRRISEVMTIASKHDWRVLSIERRVQGGRQSIPPQVECLLCGMFVASSFANISGRSWGSVELRSFQAFLSAPLHTRPDTLIDSVRCLCGDVSVVGCALR